MVQTGKYMFGCQTASLSHIYTYVYMCVDLALFVLASKPQRISFTNTSKYCKRQYLCHTTFVTCCTVRDSCYGRPETRHSRL